MCKWLQNGVSIEIADEYQKRKIKWLDSCKNYSDETKRSYWSDLETKAHDIEVAKRKDLYKFTKEEIEDILNSIATISLISVNRVASTFRKYIQWTCDTGLNYVGNPMDRISREDFYKNINVNALKESYIKPIDFINFVLDLNCSYVDKVMLILIRYGIKLKEVANIKWSDVDYENKIININKNGYDLKIEIDDLFFDILKEAKNEHEYVYTTERETINKKTREIINKTHETVINYFDGDYIIKNVEKVRSGEPDEPVKQTTLYNRIRLLCERNNIDRINLDTLNMMSKFDKLYDVLNKNGIVTIRDIENVIEYFDGKSTVSKAYLLKDQFELLADTKIQMKYSYEK